MQEANADTFKITKLADNTQPTCFSSFKSIYTMCSVLTFFQDKFCGKNSIISIQT